MRHFRIDIPLIFYFCLFTVNHTQQGFWQSIVNINKSKIQFETYSQQSLTISSGMSVAKIICKMKGLIGRFDEQRYKNTKKNL